MKRMICLILAMALLGIPLSGCSNNKPDGNDGNVGGEEQITLTIMAKSWEDVAPSKKDQFLWQEYERRTGIKVNWIEVPVIAMEERKSTTMVSGTLPDIFYQYESFTNEEIALYGSQGFFVSLDDKLDRLPNMAKMMEDMPIVRSSITMLDGHIYAFPYVLDSSSALTCRYYVHKGYLAGSGLTSIESIDDYETYMKYVKTLDIDGKQPYGVWQSPYTTWFFEMQLMGSYGLQDNGFQQYLQRVYDPGDGKLIFTFTDPKFKELWQRMAMWIDEGWWNKEILTAGVEYPEWVTAGLEGLVGSFTWSGAQFLYSTAQDDYVAFSALQGPYGRVLSWVDTPVRVQAGAMITKDCKNVDAALSWLDYFYGEEGFLFAKTGVEGITYEIIDGQYRYTDIINNYKGGRQLGAFQQGLFAYGGGLPFYEPKGGLFSDIGNQLNDTTFEYSVGCTEESILEFYPDEVWPAFLGTAEEIDELATFAGDIVTFIDESRPKFLSGQWNFDSDWDAYVNQIKNMKVDRYLEIKQAQYDRYKAGLK